MVEKIRNISNKKFILFSILSCLLILTIGTTYAFFTTNILGNSDAKSTQVYAGIMSLKLDGTTITSADGMYPGASHTIEFSVENTGTLTTTYELDMKEVYNDLNNSYMVYTITKNDELVKEETVVPQIDDILLPAVVIAPQEIDNYKLTITYKNSDSLQNSDEGKSFSGRVQISGIDSSNYLQAKVLARSINTNKVDYSYGDPIKLTESQLSTNARAKKTVAYVNDEVIVGTDYDFNEKTGLYTIKNTQTKTTYDSNDVGKYACRNISKVKSGSAESVCTGILKIENVESTDKTVNFKENITENQTVSYTSSNNKVVADSYIFDDNLGIYKLENTTEAKSYDTTDIGKYTCNNTSNECKTMYKINAIDTTKVTSVNKYTVADEGVVTATGIAYLSSGTNSIYSKSGLYQEKDDEGDAYYFRGKIDNNFVSFANQKWRIVRINGDGSIRLKLYNYTDINVFNSEGLKEKYAGYTYDNDHICTKENPCLTTTGTNSTIKASIEAWYNSKLSEYDDKIVLGSFCNDTSNIVENNMKIYGAQTRLKNNNPTLDCPNTTENYGGFYKLKVGLLSVDEYNYAGLSEIRATERSNFIYSPYGIYAKTLSPYNYDMTNEITKMYSLQNTLIFSSKPTAMYYHYPVINLKSDIKITDGDGSKSNPYVVE